MDILENKIGREDITGKYMNYFKTLTKAVVDIKKEIMAIDAELHADLEKLLLEQGSSQEDLWGINIYPSRQEESIEYVALINIRPAQNNLSMEIENPTLKERIKSVVDRFIKL